MSQRNLTEADIPEASLCGRNPGDLKGVPELKRRLLSRGASIRRKKADLVARYIVTVHDHIYSNLGQFDGIFLIYQSVHLFNARQTLLQTKESSKLA